VILLLTGLSAYWLPNASENARTAIILVQLAVTALIVWKLAAGLGLYWAASSSVGLFQTCWIRARPIRAVARTSARVDD
jgi:YidC/Oxa1 family membrane protein insertase